MSSQKQAAQDDTLTLVKIDGGMTIFQARELKDKLQKDLHGKSGLEIDLSAVSEIDTTGLQLLIALKHEFPASRLINPSPDFVRTATLLNLLSPLGLSNQDQKEEA